MQATDTVCSGDKPRESCGVFGVFGVEQASALIYRGLFSLQHRGQEGAGMAISDGATVRCVKNQGLVSEVFSTKRLDDLPGRLGIGHVRYSTTGSSRIQNVQPLVVECVDGVWAVAHNGNLVNAPRLRRMYQDGGAIFQTTTDSEVLVHLLADPLFRTRPHRVARALSQLEGSFVFLLMTKDCVMAARDPLGFRPLSMGRLGGGYVFTSETCAMAHTGVTYERDILPGELVTVDGAGVHSAFFADRPQKLAQCVFEMVYFARPDSVVFGENVHTVRVKYGMRLAEEHPVAADIVVAVPDSGNCAALGYSRRSGIPLDFGFIRNHYIGRTFIMPTEGQRVAGVDMKLAVVADVVRGKSVVVVDDSIIRGTTVRHRVAWLRQAGAREVHVRVSCPPTAHPCFYGIDFPTSEELVASRRGVDQVRQFIGADSLGYLSEDGLLSPFRSPGDFCRACFTGQYPVSVDGKLTKQVLEQLSPELPLGEDERSPGASA